MVTTPSGRPLPERARRLSERPALKDMMGDPSRLIDAAISEPESALAKLSLGILFQNHSDRTSELWRKAYRLKGDKRDVALQAISDEVNLKSYKTEFDLFFIARFGRNEDSIKAVDELERRGHTYTLLAAALATEDDEVGAYANRKIDASEALGNILLEVLETYSRSGFSGTFRAYLEDSSGVHIQDTETRRKFGFLRKLMQSREAELWAEFRSDLALLPILMKAATALDSAGRREDAERLLQGILKGGQVRRIEEALGKNDDMTMEGILQELSHEDWGQTILNTIDEWVNIKDELIQEEFALLHEILGEELFVADTREEVLMLLLPEEARKRISEDVNANFELLLSPFLTETEKESLTGMNERLARVSMNLGLIFTPMPKPFDDAASFERHVENSISALSKIYRTEEIREFAVNRVISSIMEHTKFQRCSKIAQEIVDKLSADLHKRTNGKGSLTGETLHKTFDRLQGFITYHQTVSVHHAIDFYQSIRIKAFVDNRRILVADGTGTGKTIVALGSKCEMDKLEGRRTSVLVLATSTSTDATWGQEKMDEYCEQFGYDKQKVLLIDKPQDLKKLDEGHYDIVILGYGKLGEDPENSKYLAKITGCSFDAVIVDECHNIKNFKRNRGKNAKKIIEHFKEQRILLLSATPLPNSINDGMGMLLFALDPDKHSEADKYNYNNDPERVRELVMGQRWFSITLEQIRGRNGLTEHEIEVDMNDDEIEAYFGLWKECAYTGYKMAKLQRFLTDAEFASKHGVDSLSKLDELDRIVDSTIREGGKVLIWSPWVEGTINGLLERYMRHGSVKIDGNTPRVQRYRISKVFKRSPAVNVMVISKVADEAIDLSTGDKPVTLVRIVPPLTPREAIQTRGRVDRRTQSGPVRIITLISKSEALTRLMLAFANEELAKIGLTPPRNFLAQTIDRDVRELLEWKLAITKKVFRSEKLTKNQLDLWKMARLESNEQHLNSSLMKTLKHVPDFTRAIFLDHKFRGAGAVKVAEFMGGKTGHAYATFYERGWEGSHSQHTLALIARSIHAEGIQGKSIVDFGGAAGYASRTLQYPTTVVDLNDFFMEMGKAICEEQGLATEFVKADMRHSGLPSRKTDALIASYCLHHLLQTEEERQVEEALLEMNRLLVPGSKIYLTFPWSAGTATLKAFAKGIAQYGFTVTDESGVYLPIFEDRKNGKKILLLVARKESDVTKLAPSIYWENFVIFGEKDRPRFAADRHKQEIEKNNKKKEVKKPVDFKKIDTLSL